MKIMLQWTFEDTVIDDALLDFGNLLEYAAMLHDTRRYRESLRSDIFPMVLRMIGSGNLLHSLLGIRVLQHLLDRHNNRLQFDTPRYCFVICGLISATLRWQLPLIKCNFYAGYSLKTLTSMSKSQNTIRMISTSCGDTERCCIPQFCLPWNSTACTGELV